LKAETGIDAELQVGSPGQFEVLVDGETIASRSSSIVSRFLGGGWPDPNDVVQSVRTRQRASA
jgi:predicted Rdx family selenoprotein